MRYHKAAVTAKASLTSVTWYDVRVALPDLDQAWQQVLGDPRLYVCQAPNAFICVSPCGSIFGPFLVHFGSILGPFRVHFGSISGPFRVHFGSILGPFWVHFGSISGPFGVHLGSIWGPFRGSISIQTRIGI